MKNKESALLILRARAVSQSDYLHLREVRIKKVPVKLALLKNVLD